MSNHDLLNRAVPERSDEEIIDFAACSETTISARDIAVLKGRGLSSAEIAAKHDLSQEEMDRLAGKVSQSILHLVKNVSSEEWVGTILFAHTQAITELQYDLQDARKQGKIKLSNELRREIRAETKSMLDLLDRIGKLSFVDIEPTQKEVSDIMEAVRNSLNGEYIEPESMDRPQRFR